MSQHGQDEQNHKELSEFGSALKLVWWRYGRRIGLLGVILLLFAGTYGDNGWFYDLPRPLGSVVGWTCVILFFTFLYLLVRSRPGRQQCRRCNAPFRKITFVSAHRVGSFDQIVMRCEACGHQWLWEDSP